MAAVVFIHRRAGHRSPVEDPALNSVLGGLRRDMVGKKPPRRQAPALMTDDVEQVLTTIDASPTRGRALVEVQDRALLLLAFTSAMRASELAARDVDDLEPVAEGLVVRVRSSKTDQEGAGAFIAIPYARRPHLCTVRAVDEWLERLAHQLTVQDTHPSGRAAAGSGEATRLPARSNARRRLDDRRALIADLDGALLRAVRGGRIGSTTTPDPHQARMARLAITTTITARAAGLQAQDAGGRYYSAHSTRAGFATQAAEGGVSERDIMNHGRWKSVAVARSYIRRGDLFDDNNPAAHLGL